MGFDYDEWASSLRIVGDQALLPSERVPRPYRRLTDEERATYKRDWMRRYRARLRADRQVQVLHAVASLHGLACTGPTQATGCRCRKVMLYRREDAA
jgi:hypothetical protein